MTPACARSAAAVEGADRRARRRLRVRVHRGAGARRRAAGDDPPRRHGGRGQRHRAADHRRHAAVRVGQDLHQPAVRAVPPDRDFPRIFDAVPSGASCCSTSWSRGRTRSTTSPPRSTTCSPVATPRACSFCGDDDRSVPTSSCRDPRFEVDGLRHATVNSRGARSSGDVTFWAPRAPTSRCRSSSCCTASTGRTGRGPARPARIAPPRDADRAGASRLRAGDAVGRAVRARQRLRAPRRRRLRRPGSSTRCRGSRRRRSRASIRRRRSRSPGCRWAGSAPCCSAPRRRTACTPWTACRRSPTSPDALFVGDISGYDVDDDDRSVLDAIGDRAVATAHPVRLRHDRPAHRAEPRAARRRSTPRHRPRVRRASRRPRVAVLAPAPPGGPRVRRPPSPRGRRPPAGAQRLELLAHHEPRHQDDVVRAAARGRVDEQLPGRPPDLVGRLGDDGECGGASARPAASRRSRRGRCRRARRSPRRRIARRAPSGHQVVGHEQRVGAAVRLEERAGGLVAALLAVVGPADEGPLEGDAGRRESGPVAGEALVRRRHGRRADDAARRAASPPRSGARSPRPRR